MLVERAELTARAGAEADFHAAMTTRGVPLLRGIKGVTFVQFGRGVENPGTFILLVGWRGMDAHDTYNRTPECGTLRALMGQHLTGGAMEHFEID